MGRAWIESPYLQAAVRNMAAFALYSKARATLDAGTVRGRCQVMEENTGFKQDVTKPSYRSLVT